MQRQWVIRLEAGANGAEVGTVLKALAALGLSIVVGNEPGETSGKAAPASNLDEVFARLATREPPALPGTAEKPPGKKSGGRRR